MEQVTAPVESVKANLVASHVEAGPPAPHLKIRPPGPFSPLALAELWQFRDLFAALAVRDVKLRYKQTALGVIWVILQPLLGAGIFSFVFGKVAKMPSDGLPYIVFSYTGLLGWQAFNSTLTKASACVVGNAQLVSKVFFPRLILPLSTVLSTLIDFAVGFAVMVLLMFIYGILPGPGILLMPVLLLLLILLAVGLGLYTSALMVEFRDLQYAIPVLLQFLLYASPIAYSVSAVPEHLRFWYMLNPISALLEAFRWSLLNRGELNWGGLGYSAAIVVAVFIFGTFAFKRMERRFADVI
jgi:lipopolysaccharide transport system permease protein